MRISKAKQERLAKMGGRVTTVEEFFQLTPEQRDFIEMKLELGGAIKSRRTALGLSQQELARRMGSEQARVAKIEAGDPSIGYDLVIRALFSLGLDRQKMVRLLSGQKPAVFKSVPVRPIPPPVPKQKPAAQK